MCQEYDPLCGGNSTAASSHHTGSEYDFPRGQESCDVTIYWLFLGTFKKNTPIRSIIHIFLTLKPDLCTSTISPHQKYGILPKYDLNMTDISTKEQWGKKVFLLSV